MPDLARTSDVLPTPARRSGRHDCMIIGSGLLARASATHVRPRDETWIYAAGVSNSGCTDSGEFQRERRRLSEAIERGAGADAFVYFSTCSVSDPNSAASMYVKHKLAMESEVAGHPRYVVVRLPQLAGRTPNPHTLLNYLHARISRSEAFAIWARATRNIIDVDDAAAIVAELLGDGSMRRVTVNVANAVSHPVREIVAAMEESIGKPAVTRTVDDGAGYAIDISAVEPYIRRLGIAFDESYLRQVARKYYGAGR